MIYDGPCKEMLLLLVHTPYGPHGWQNGLGFGAGGGGSWAYANEKRRRPLFAYSCNGTSLEMLLPVPSRPYLYSTDYSADFSCEFPAGLLARNQLAAQRFEVVLDEDTKLRLGSRLYPKPRSRVFWG